MPVSNPPMIAISDDPTIIGNIGVVGFYRAFDNETLDVPLGRISYSTEQAITEGVINIDGLLEVH